MDFKIAHEQGVNVQLLAEAIHRNEVEVKIKLGKVENSHRQLASSRMYGSQPVGLLPNSLLRHEGRFEVAQVVQGWLALLMSSKSFSRSSREGFWPEIVRKNTGSWATSFSSLRT
jgi:hypothetical protein